MGVLFEFNVGRAGDKGLDVEGWEGDEIGFWLVGGIGWCEGK